MFVASIVGVVKYKFYLPPLIPFRVVLRVINLSIYAYKVVINSNNANDMGYLSSLGGLVMQSRNRVSCRGN